MDNVTNLDDYKKLEDIIRERVGDKFVISFLDEEQNVYTYMSSNLNHMEQVYIGENIKEIAFDKVRDER